MSHWYRTAVVALMALAVSSYAAAATAKSHAVVGTLQKIDGQNLVIQTKKGTEKVTLASSARIHTGATTIQAINLPSYIGQRIKVRYIDRNGEKDAQTVALASPSKGISRKK